mmetsp:Transcript_39941/g.38496  ORF Transcript_39941/g.38496 Transcript_39941/m.38496 type:complete len:123 (+) Transcript_39941:109-477(+)
MLLDFLFLTIDLRKQSLLFFSFFLYLFLVALKDDIFLLLPESPVLLFQHLHLFLELQFFSFHLSEVKLILLFKGFLGLLLFQEELLFFKLEDPFLLPLLLSLALQVHRLHSELLIVEILELL